VATQQGPQETRNAKPAAKGSVAVDQVQIVEALNIVAGVSDLINQLKDEVLQQKQNIEILKTGQQSAQKERRELIDENKSLQKQVAELTEQVRKLVQSPRTAGTAGPQDHPPANSWAVVAARGGALQPAPPTYNTQSGNSPTTLRINTPMLPSAPGATAESFTRYMQTDQAVESISQALRKYDTTKEAEVLGVGSTKLGYLVRFRNAKSKELAQRNTEWVEELGPGTRIVKPRFGVVAHCTPTDEVNMEEKEETVRKIALENNLSSKGYGIEEIAWLKKKDTPLGRSASLGIWFDTAEAAEQAIQNGLIFGQRFITSIELYRMERKRCFRCQGFGHLAWNCREKQRCGHCCGEHSMRNCAPDATPKCADCAREHSTGSAQCRNTATLNGTQC
jgi:hypothetical protein